MKKKIGILALILVIAMCISAISALAVGEDSGNSQIPFVDSDEITPVHPDIQTEDELMEEFEKMFGESAKVFFTVIIVGVIFSFLFLPCLVLVVIFGVLNSKTKKKVKEYERFFGPIPQNISVYHNPNINNITYGAQPVNPTGSPMGTTPTGNLYVPQNDINNQQGGQF